MQMSCRQYITETKIYTQSGQTDTNANSVLFINTGSDNVNIDGLILQPSQSWAIDGNQDEILIKVYSFAFVTTAAPSLTVIFKRYV
jgi:hypothetical protein